MPDSPSFGIMSSPRRTERSSRARSRSRSARPAQYVRSPSRYVDANIPHQTLLVPCIPGLRYLQESKYKYINTGLFKINGYEVYVVEQWATRRSNNACIVCYTGNPEHTVTVASITIPIDEDLWSPRLRVFVNELSKMNARKNPCEEHNAYLYVTNLSSFPSGLTLITVPDGDVTLHLKDFILNETLRRIGCGARSGISLNKPTDASRDKFYQLYKISDRAPFEDAVIDLIILVQVSLHYFGLFKLSDVDGLLCDMTEKALNTWWHDIGVGHYGSQSEKSLGPATIAAILGMVTGYRHRLNAAGVAVPKDPFEVEAFKLSISGFQKQNKLKINQVFDANTRDSLCKIPGNISASERFAITKVVKTTVQDLSGIKSQVASDVETTEYDKFLQNVYGHTLRHLFLGKGNTREYEKVITSLSKLAYTWQNILGSNKNEPTLLNTPPSTIAQPGNLDQNGPGTSASGTSAMKNASTDTHTSRPPSKPASILSAHYSSPPDLTRTEYTRDIPVSGFKKGTETDLKWTASEDIVTSKVRQLNSVAVAYDQVPDFVRLQRKERKGGYSESEDTLYFNDISSSGQTHEMAGEVPSKVHSKKGAMHRQKIKTDEAFRKAGNYLRNRKGRAESDDMHSQKGHPENASVASLTKHNSISASLSESENVPISAESSVGLLLSPDESLRGRNGKKYGASDVSEHGNDDTRNGLGYDQGRPSEEDLHDEQLLHTYTAADAASHMSDTEGDSSEHNQPSLTIESELDHLREERLRLEAIEDELKLYAEHWRRHKHLIGPRRAYSVSDLEYPLLPASKVAYSETEEVPYTLSAHRLAIATSKDFPKTESVQSALASVDDRKGPVRRGSFSCAENAIHSMTGSESFPSESILRLLKRVSNAKVQCLHEVERTEV